MALNFRAPLLRTAATLLVGAGAWLGTLAPILAADKVSFLTSWFAQAEHGGFYQAKATGLYDRAGLDVDLRMGGPQINGIQLLTGGDADIMMGFDTQAMTAVEHGLPVVAVAASFQYDMQGIMTHPDIKSLDALKGHKILLASTAYSTFWPWLKERYGYTDDQAGAYTFNLQPFFTDPALAQQAYATAEPFEAKKTNVPINFYLFAKFGYPPYGETVITTHPYLTKNPDVVKRFVAASMEGWKSYMHDPAPGNALIKVENPKQSDAQLAYSISQLKALGAVTSGDAATHGIGVMTDARWQATREFLVRNNLLKEATDWKSAYTLDCVKNLRVVA